MDIVSKANSVRISPKKLRKVADLVRGLNVNKAHNLDIYDHFFDQEIRDHIEKIYSDIFDDFNYSFEELFNDS